MFTPHHPRLAFSSSSPFDLSPVNAWKLKTPQEVAYITILRNALSTIYQSKVATKILSTYVFGSFATRTLSPHSDIDLRIIVSSTESAVDLLQLKNAVKESTGRVVNLGFYFVDEVVSGDFRSRFLKGCRTPPKFFFRILPPMILLQGSPVLHYAIPATASNQETRVWLKHRLALFATGRDYDGFNRGWDKKTQDYEIFKLRRLLSQLNAQP